MNEAWSFYAVPMSYFSAKLRPALRYKKIPFHEIWANAAVYREVIVPKVGWPVIPVLISSQGECLQDSPRMLERIEEMVPQPPLFPADPALRMVAEVIQDFCDEAMLLPAMHFRWSFPEQRKWIENDWSSTMGPESLEFARRMEGSLAFLGISERTKPLIDDWYVELLDLLDSHFETNRFVLGDALSLADLALAGPFYAHLGRDPVPARIMRERAPWVMTWLHEVNDAAPPAPWAAEPVVAPTLLPLLAEIGRVFVPMQLAASAAGAEAAASLASGEAVPRVLGFCEQPLLGIEEQRMINSYSLWRHRRSAARYAALDSAARERVAGYLEPAGIMPYLEQAPEAAIEMDGFALRMA